MVFFSELNFEIMMSIQVNYICIYWTRIVIWWTEFELGELDFECCRTEFGFWPGFAWTELDVDDMEAEEWCGLQWCDAFGPSHHSTYTGRR